MSLSAVGLILIAAIAHASWNLYSKQASAAGAAIFVWLLGTAAACLYAPVVIITVLADPPRLAGLNWLFLAGTGVLECGYFLVLQSGYRLGDLSVVYPIGRGTGALLAALAGVLAFGERPGPVSIAGICCIIIGIVAIGLPARAADGGAPAGGSIIALKPVAFALCTGMFIAAYTLWDKYAVATLRTPALLQGYATFPMIMLVFAPFALRDHATLHRVWHEYRRQIIGAGLLAPLAYVLVLIALSFSPVSAVAPAREVSVLFGVLLGRKLLGEGGLPRKLAAAAAIVAGIIAVAVG